MTSKPIFFILSRFLWFFSKTPLGCNILSLSLFLKLINAKCHWLVLWPTCSAICEFIFVSYAIIFLVFYIILSIPTPRRYFVGLFGGKFLRGHLPDDQMAKKLLVAVMIFGWVKIITYLIGFL